MTALDQEIIEHMANPKNYGSMENPDAIGIGENPDNGEQVIIYLRVHENEQGDPVIDDIKFQAIGCMTTVVAGSIITGEANGIDFKTGEDLISVTLGMLEDVPPEEAACSEMVARKSRKSSKTTAISNLNFVTPARRKRAYRSSPSRAMSRLSSRSSTMSSTRHFVRELPTSMSNPRIGR